VSDSIFRVIYVIGLIAGSVVRVLYTRHYRRERISDNRKTGLDALLLFFSSLGLFYLPLIYLLTPWLDFADYCLPAWAGCIGAAVFAAGIMLLWMSHADLGHNWAPTLQIMEEHILVTRGVYRYIRHPMYAAHWLWGIAQVLLLENWIAGFSMLVFLLPLYLLRVPREEQMMLGHFGDEYHDYMNRTGGVIPRLWK